MKEKRRLISGMELRFKFRIHAMLDRFGDHKRTSSRLNDFSLECTTHQNIGVGTVPHPLPVGVSRT
jgi:hypothetical protein